MGLAIDSCVLENLYIPRFNPKFRSRMNVNKVNVKVEEYEKMLEDIADNGKFTMKTEDTTAEGDKDDPKIRESCRSCVSGPLMAGFVNQPGDTGYTKDPLSDADGSGEVIRVDVVNPPISLSVHDFAMIQQPTFPSSIPTPTKVYDGWDDDADGSVRATCISADRQRSLCEEDLRRWMLS